MSDFNQALKWMKEGKKVRRKCSQKCIFEKDEHTGFINLSNDDKRFHLVDFESKDWEIYESSGEFLHRLGTDGDLWAREFIKSLSNIEKDNEIDLDLMRGWFCNAIEAGRQSK